MSNPPLELHQRIRLDGLLYARFDGKHIRIETHTGNAYVLRLMLTPIAMAHLHWLSGRVSDTFPDAWCINLADVDDAMDGFGRD